MASEFSISEYTEGTSNNKAMEIYNGTGAAVNLSVGDYNIQMYFDQTNGSGRFNGNDAVVLR